MKRVKLLRVAGIALAGLMMISLSPPAFSQNCALCYTQAASAGARMIEALRSGILVLIIPPTLMWLVIAAIAYSKRNQFKHAGNVPGPDSDW
jgi:DNA-binding transcriptional regulator YdaS (Cro superfamily)